PAGSPAPPKAVPGLSETERLRVTVLQLEHALRTRVAVEQAIGVLAERHRISPRTAFERLRRAARCRGKKVAVLAQGVVDSTRNPLIALPEEVAREGSAGQVRQSRRAGEAGAAPRPAPAAPTGWSTRCAGAAPRTSVR